MTTFDDNRLHKFRLEQLANVKGRSGPGYQVYLDGKPVQMVLGMKLEIEAGEAAVLTLRLVVSVEPIGLDVEVEAEDGNQE